ncbi:MAG: glutathione S-transferase family protein [Novosphingobium sp.]|nr:glutathione S-transferase family protein [Novosphingobium sp.]
MMFLTLVSHHLCPYVQRAAIVAREKGIAFTRVDIDLAAKPDWFLAISPTGKTPLLRVRDEEGAEHILFESAVIAEFCDEIAPGRLLPEEPLARAHHRAWVEFASGTLADIAGLYGAPDAAGYAGKVDALRSRFGRVDAAVAGPWFGGERFGLVDAAFAPVFRYLDAFEALLALDLAGGQEMLSDWRARLASRPSVQSAVAPDYAERLAEFLRRRGSHLSGLLGETVTTTVPA